MNRRELLQFFGVGAVVAPVVGGTVVGEAAAKLIEVPKVEAFSTMPKLFKGCFPSNPYAGGGLRVQDPIRVWVNGVEKKGIVAQMTTGFSYSNDIDVTMHDSAHGFKKFIPGAKELRLDLMVIVTERT